MKDMQWTTIVFIMKMYFKLKHVLHKCIYEPTFECNNYKNEQRCLSVSKVIKSAVFLSNDILFFKTIHFIIYLHSFVFN